MDEAREFSSPAHVSCGAKLKRCGANMRTKSSSKATARLGEVVSELMEQQISPRQGRFGPVAELWSDLLPAELGLHCRLADISGGQLKVLVDSPSYMQELRLCREDLLRELQRRCPRARINQIKITIG